MNGRCIRAHTDLTSSPDSLHPESCGLAKELISSLLIALKALQVKPHTNQQIEALRGDVHIEALAQWLDCSIIIIIDLSA